MFRSPPSPRRWRGWRKSAERGCWQAEGNSPPPERTFTAPPCACWREADQLDDKIRKRESGELRLAYFITFADRVSALLPEFERRFPGRRVAACQANHREMLGRIEKPPL